MTSDAEKKIEEAVLALLYATSFEQGGARCAWKTYDWGITERLFEQGFIDDPRTTFRYCASPPHSTTLKGAASTKRRDRP